MYDFALPLQLQGCIPGGPWQIQQPAATPGVADSCCGKCEALRILHSPDYISGGHRNQGFHNETDLSGLSGDMVQPDLLSWLDKDASCKCHAWINFPRCVMTMSEHQSIRWLAPMMCGHVTSNTLKVRVIDLRCHQAPPSLWMHLASHRSGRLMASCSKECTTSKEPSCVPQAAALPAFL